MQHFVTGATGFIANGSSSHCCSDAGRPFTSCCDRKAKARWPPCSPVLHDQAREREDRAQGSEGPLDRVPPRAGRRRLAHRRDAQDRRPALLFRADPAHAPDPAAVDAIGRPRRRPHQHRAGRFCRRRARPHQSPEERSRSQVPSSRGPEGVPGRRRARHHRQGRARVEDERVHQRGAARMHPEEREEGPAGARPGATREERGAERPRPARGHAAGSEEGDSRRGGQGGARGDLLGRHRRRSELQAAGHLAERHARRRRLPGQQRRAFDPPRDRGEL